MSGELTGAYVAGDAASILRRARRLRFRLRRQSAIELAGAYQSARPGVGLLFSELRAYEPGDDVRHIDWNVTARQGRPYVRRFVEERALVLWLVLDVSASMRFGQRTRTKADRAAQCAALLAAAAVESGDRVGLLLVSDRVEYELRPAGGMRQLSRVLRALVACATDSPRTDLGLLLPRLRRARRRTLTVVLSDFDELGDSARWRAAAARHDIVAARLVDVLDSELPAAGWIDVQDPETGRRATLRGSSRRVRDEYRREAEERARGFTRWCVESGIDGLTLMTSDDPFNAILAFLRRRHRPGGWIGSP